MYGTSSLTVHGDYDVILIGRGLLEVRDEPEVVLIGTSECYATAYLATIGNALLPAITGIGSDFEYAIGSAELPSVFQNSGDGGFWVPTAITIGFGSLPKIGGSGVVVTIHGGDGSAELPAIIGIGGDFKYGSGSAMLPSITAFGMYGLPNDEADMIDYMVVGSLQETDRILTVIFVSDGNITDTMSLTRIQAVEFISQLEQSDLMTVLGTFTESFIENLTAISRNSQNIVSTDGNVKPDVNDAGMVWVVNTETGASSQYEQYGFNSFFIRPSDGKAYGICPSGIYRLTGDTDDGIEISALADFGRSDYGTPYKKKIPYIYLGVGSNGMLYLKVDADGDSYIYEMRNNSTAVKNHRVDIGKGLHGNYWNPVLMNKNGSNFDLNAVQFEPIISSRKI